VSPSASPNKPPLLVPVPMIKIVAVERVALKHRFHRDSIGRHSNFQDMS
jgi:hypothetical protein